MNFNTIFLRSFRIVLFPFALGYGLIIVIRNFLYNRGVFKTTSFNIPIICVGNLSVGGTGKSPMVEYLAGLLKDRYHVATLSRGYKRRTRGYLLAGPATTALEIGDEPMQFHMNHPEVSVAVGEQRIEAIPQLLFDRPDTSVILLDDAFQHRAITAGFNLLLTDHGNLYTRDFYLPTGDLRDQPASARRADCVIVTKCPSDLSADRKKKIIAELERKEAQDVFFSSIRYGEPYHIVNRTNKKLARDMEVLLVCGIANPEPLKKYLHDTTDTYEAIYYNDHHIFTIDDLNDIMFQFRRMRSEHKLIITTEKDAVRLLKFRDQLEQIPFYVLPITVSFLFQETGKFNDLIINFIETFHNG